ncbi:MAG: glycine/sarcosine/betaine reductase component B subunit [Chloroflexota bacterium]|nr:glycine/sarcosine/betaine reductase component B subunit [Chloroflexota bacterium]
MRLDLASYQTRDVRLGAHTRWHDGVLEIDRDEMLALVKRDSLVEKADVQIARPGESVRIVTVRDILDPRMKVAGDGIAYPGILGRPVATVGQGRTNRYDGLGLVACAVRQDPPRPGYVASGPSRTAYNNYIEFIDMSGPGAITPWSKLWNVCLIVEPARHLDRDASNRVVQAAMLTAQDYLAKATVGAAPTSVETFDMTPKPGLPGLVWIHSLVSPEAGTRNPDSTLGTAVYGVTRLTQPWLLHPTEILDGACCGAYMGWLTWPITNTIGVHMCRQHGKEFNFLGCIMVRTMWEEQRLKELMGNRAALVAKSLGADGAVVTPTLRGQRFLDTITVVQACERSGIKTVLITEEEDDEDGMAPPMLVSGPEVVAVVSTGTGSAPGPFPPVKRVIGAGTIGQNWYGEQEPPHGRYGTSHMYDVLGFSNWACVAH